MECSSSVVCHADESESFPPGTEVDRGTEERCSGTEVDIGMAECRSVTDVDKAKLQSVVLANGANLGKRELCSFHEADVCS